MSAILERTKTVSYDQILKERFKKDPDQILEHLNAMLGAPKEPELFLLGLRQVATALGMTQLSTTRGLGRESLYKTLSEEGNPTIKTLLLLLDAMGLQLSVIRKQEETQEQEES
jgi:probable addiction module antidote protein